MAYGTVKWFNAVKGYGFIVPDDGEKPIFVHYSSILVAGHRTLIEGQIVQFEVASSNGKLAAHNIIFHNERITQTDLVPKPIRRSLSVFLCHSSNDKPKVRELYYKLKGNNIDPWLDEEKILPGQKWKVKISKAIRRADLVLICLSCGSIVKEGYVQKEIKEVLDIVDEKPDDKIFLIPVRLEDCIVPERISEWQCVDYYLENGYKRLLESLSLRAVDLNVCKPTNNK